jgi:hypothetical protein
MNKRRKRGALELSFGMIFSIVLIVAFLAFGVYAIIKLLAMQETIQIESFLSDFQNDVDSMWKSSGSQNLVYSLPTSIKAVCFKNDEFQNLEFSSDEITKGEMIEHLDIEKTTEDENPLCIANNKGRVNLKLVKEYGETLVTVER